LAACTAAFATDAARSSLAVLTASVFIALAVKRAALLGAYALDSSNRPVVALNPDLDILGDDDFALEHQGCCEYRA
jgi:hypothetical protein